MINSLMKSLSFVALLVFIGLSVFATYQMNIEGLILSALGDCWFYYCYKIFSGKGGV